MGQFQHIKKQEIIASKIMRLLCFLSFLIVFPSQTFAQSKEFAGKRFDFAPSSYGLLTVHGSQVLGHLNFYAGVGTYFADRPYFLLTEKNEILEPVSQRIMSEITASLGVWKWFDVSVALPIFLRQWSVSYPTPGASEIGSSGLGDLRIHLKGQALSPKNFHGFGLSVAVDVGISLGGENTFHRSPSPTIYPRVIADYRHSSGIYLALNAGFFWQEKITLGNFALGQEIRIGGGLEVPLFIPGLSILGEAFGGIALPQDQILKRDQNAHASSLEVAVGLRWQHKSGVGLAFGASSGLSSAPGTPNYRVFFRISYSLRRNIDPNMFRKNTLVTSKVIKSEEKKYYSYYSQGFPGKDITKKRKVRQLPWKPHQIQKVGSAKQTFKEPPPYRAYRPPSPKAFQKAIKKDPDPDGDGIPSSKDKCPKKAEDFDKFQDEDGCPDLDNDRDGVPDKVDKCPNKAEVVNGVDDDDGCPDKGKSSVVFTSGKITIRQKVYFDLGSDVLKPESYPILKEVAAFIKNVWQLQLIRIEGHTDSIGDKEKNVDLAERRARRVMSFLIEKGVEPSRLKSKGYGSKRPIDTNRTKGGRSKNRRVSFVVEKLRKTYSSQKAPKKPMKAPTKTSTPDEKKKKKTSVIKKNATTTEPSTNKEQATQQSNTNKATPKEQAPGKQTPSKPTQQPSKKKEVKDAT